MAHTKVYRKNKPPFVQLMIKIQEMLDFKATTIQEAVLILLHLNTNLRE
jgi:hypothetical protein